MVSRILKNTAAVLLVGACAVAWPNSPHAQTVPQRAVRRMAVVVNRSSTVAALNPAEVRRIFLRERTVWPNGDAISVFEQPADTSIRRQFDEIVLRKSPASLAEYWLNLRLTRGLEPPRVCQTTTLLKLYLQRVKGGVGYLEEREVDETTRVIAWIEVPS